MRRRLHEPFETAFELPPRFPVAERRRAGLAVAAWHAGQDGPVPGHDDHCVIVDDPGGDARIVRVGVQVSDTFGLVADLPLHRRDPLGAELCAACDLIAIDPRPLHFEASLIAPGRACILFRGVALPIGRGASVQIILSWREVLDRAATTRLRRDLTTALRQTMRISSETDPFCTDFGQNRAT